MSDTNTTETPRLEAKRLKVLAAAQRGVLGGLLSSIFLVVGTLLIPAEDTSRPAQFFHSFVPYMRLALAVIIPVGAYLMLGALGRRRWQVVFLLLPLAAALAPASLQPFVGPASLVYLVALLVINRDATRVLRAHGIKVGFLGADRSATP